jgi:hypothetical protein
LNDDEPEDYGAGRGHRDGRTRLRYERFIIRPQFAYAQFYGVFGVTPEDVGIGYAQTLTQSSMALIYSLSIGVLLVVPLWLFHQDLPEESLTSALGSFARRYLQLILSIVVLALAVLLLAPAHVLRGRVLKGEPIEANTSFTPGLGWGTLLGITVHSVSLDWLEGNPPASVRLAKKHRLMYLGRSGSTVVLYDVDGTRTLRLPRAQSS